MELLWKDKKRGLFGLPLSCTHYSFDEECLYVRTGFLSLTEDEVRLHRILDLTLKQSLWQRLAGIGTIHCCSSDASMGEFELRGIKNPRQVKHLLSDQIEKQRMRKRVSYREELDENPLAHAAQHPINP